MLINQRSFCSILQVKTFLMHFWCGVPDHVNEILKNERIPEIVVACDAIFYKVLSFL